MNSVLQAEGEQKGSLKLQFSCHPNLHLKASGQHSVEALQMLGFPTHGGITVNVSAGHLPGAEFDLELGGCYFRGNLGKTKASQKGEEHSSYTVNVTNYCPALQVGISSVYCCMQGKPLCLTCKYYSYL